MTRVIAYVEGPTEEKFIKDTVAPLFWPKKIFIQATTPGRERFQGGVQAWSRIRGDLLRYLKEDPARRLTTMFDYYRMPTDWPGRESDNAVAYTEKAITVEQAMADDIFKEMGTSFNRQRFIPYVQMHEFEALLFSKPDVLAGVIQEPKATGALQTIANKFPTTPEEIDDNPQTAPSKRILGIFPGYQKVLHGNIVAQRIGLEIIRGRCPHFNQWLCALETLALESDV